LFFYLHFEVLKIRLQRKGRRNRPFYRIVVAEKSNPVQGRFLEIVGHYDPLTKDTVFKSDRIEYFLSNGAQPSQTVARLGVKSGVNTLEKYIEKRVSKPKKEKTAESE